MRWREFICTAFGGWRLTSISLTLALAIACSYMIARNELIRIELKEFTIAVESVLSLSRNTVEDYPHQLIGKYMALPDTYLEVSEYYSELARICAELSSLSPDDSASLAETSADYAGQSLEYLKRHEDYVRKLILTMLFWCAGPAVVAILYVIGVGMTKKQAFNYRSAIGILSLYGIVFIKGASGDGPSDPDTAAHMHIVLVPILLGAPAFLVFVFMLFNLSISVRRDASTDPSTSEEGYKRGPSENIHRS